MCGFKIRKSKRLMGNDQGFPTLKGSQWEIQEQTSNVAEMP